jgi:hypothetical protein
VSDEKFTPVEAHGNMIADSYHIAFSIKIIKEIIFGRTCDTCFPLKLFPLNRC